MPTKMKDDPCWLDVTEVMKAGAGKTMQKLLQIEELQEEIPEYLNRINAIENIKSIDLHIEEVAGGEGDLEPHIYHRLFHFIHQLEDEANDQPNFQYIIATTTPPPENLNKRPYVRETLDRRTGGGLLLKTEF